MEYDDKLSAGINCTIDIMKREFPGIVVNVVGDMFRLEPSEYAPAGALVVWLDIKLHDDERLPFSRYLLQNAVAEEIAWYYPITPTMIHEVVYAVTGDTREILKGIYEEILNKHKNGDEHRQAQE